jgi:hypothetical protein
MQSGAVRPLGAASKVSFRGYAGSGQTGGDMLQIGDWWRIAPIDVHFAIGHTGGRSPSAHGQNHVVAQLYRRDYTVYGTYLSSHNH